MVLGAMCGVNARIWTKVCETGASTEKACSEDLRLVVCSELGLHRLGDHGPARLPGATSQLLPPQPASPQALHRWPQRDRARSGPHRRTAPRWRRGDNTPAVGDPRGRATLERRARPSRSPERPFRKLWTPAHHFLDLLQPELPPALPDHGLRRRHLGRALRRVRSAARAWMRAASSKSVARA